MIEIGPVIDQFAIWFHIQFSQLTIIEPNHFLCGKQSRIRSSSIVNDNIKILMALSYLWSQLQVNCTADLTRKAAGVYCVGCLEWVSTVSF